MVVVVSNTDLGCAVRRLRCARQVTIEALAFTADIHPTYLSGIERGVRNPTWKKVCDLATALDVPVSQLARQAEDESEIARAARETRARLLDERSRPPAGA